MRIALSIVIAAAGVVLWIVPPPVRGADASAAAPAAMTSTKTQGEVSIVPEPNLVNGELILKVVALNQSQKPAPFGPGDIQIATADGKAVPLMTLEELIAQVKADAQSRQSDSGSYGSSYTQGPATTYSRSGQPDIHNFRGNSAPVGGQVNPEEARSAPADSGALAQQIASLQAGILQDMTIAPGEVKGGEVVSERIKFHWREKHTLRIVVRFNGEQHAFELPAPPAQ